MHSFMIGLYGGFDENKYERDFRRGFYGIEACLFETEEDIARLAFESKQRGFQIGIHFPFRKDGSRLRDALFLSQDNEVRDDAYASIERELQDLFEIQPAYILFHYPKPVILDDRVNWDSWKFADRREYVRESEYTLAELACKSERLFEWLSAKAREYGFTPVLEFDALNRYVYEENFLVSLLERYPLIKLCLDTARLHAQEKIDPHFDARRVLRTYAKYAKTVHLSNMRITDVFEYHHHPALPDCKPEDGWAPIEDYLQIIKRENQEVTIMFEHRSDWITDEELETCYEWIDQIMNGHTQKIPLPAAET
ncbi:sugar phosphate isomerase/epimerase [Brevibacillus choshinensis]|uniref:Sugar phosphate isomerase/epimerase n=1 Tax=Brevibacillus choshinensis TaxID=54911 RepID=A0ABX7FGN8_BRECH|nr:sugar phosphate isomerase/epimerase [Brevibacillus choshinensis]QRG65359.1 sugar phosphate isomerase/epimerase [Brevibacillus choshinensis]